MTNSLLQLLDVKLDTFRSSKDLYYCLKLIDIEYVAPDRIWYFSYSYHYNKKWVFLGLLDDINFLKTMVSLWIIPRNYLCTDSFGFKAVFYVLSQPNDRFQLFLTPRMIDSVIDMIIDLIFASKFLSQLCAVFKKP